MDFKEYQKDTYVAIQDHPTHKDEILNWAVGLAEEVGESLKHIKHHYWGHEDFNMTAMALELGDVLWYLSALCTALHLDLDIVARINKEKLARRFPHKFSDALSQRRHESEKAFIETEVYKELRSMLVDNSQKR